MAKQCTKCKKMFSDESLIVCPDCKMGLITIVGAPAAPAEENKAEEEAQPVQEEEKKSSPFSLQNEDSAARAVEYLKEQGIDAEYQYAFRERIFKVYVKESDKNSALRAYTSFYSLEAKRIKEEEERKKAEEEAKRRAEEEARRAKEEEERRKKEEEERKIREAEEAKKRAEQERIAAQQAALRKAEEDAQRAKQEAENAKYAAEAKIRAEEAAKIQAAEIARQKAEADAKAKLAEVERLKAQAEEAKRKAEEAKLRIEQEAKRRAEEERKKAAEEAIRRKEEEARRAEIERQQKRRRFEENIRAMTADQETPTPRTGNKFDFGGSEGKSSKFGFGSDPSPFGGQDYSSDGPIFVETEPVDEYEVGDTIVVDAVEVDTDEPSPSPFSSGFDTRDEAPKSDIGGGFNPNAFDDLFKSTEKFKSPFSGFASEPVPEPTPDPIRETPKPEPASEAIVEDMFTDNLFTQNTAPKTENKYVFEEVINDDLKASSPASKFEKAFSEASATSPSSSTKTGEKKSFAERFSELENLDDLDDNAFKGFVPDYHAEEEGEDPDKALAEAYGFDPDKYKELKQRTEKKAKERKENNKYPKKKEGNKDFIVEDEAPLDDIAGFVPDYSNKDNMKYYTGRTEIDYSKYRKKTAGGEEQTNSLAELTGTLRSSSHNELTRLFSKDVIANASAPTDFSVVKQTSYLLALTGGQLNSLFTSWLITNCTRQTVKQYENPAVSSDENYKLKIEGIKLLLRSNFGKLDDATLDIIVTKFYNKYLDE